MNKSFVNAASELSILLFATTFTLITELVSLASTRTI